MITSSRSHFHATDGHAYPMRSFAWAGLPILDACAVQANYGQLLMLTTNGAIHGINLDTEVCVKLCAVNLPDIPTDGNEYFGVARCRLHATPDGTHAAIVVDNGTKGIVVEVLSGTVTMELDGGDYHEDTVPFSACFLRFEGRNVLVHRTAWNRLDAADPATGESLTERDIAPCEAGRENPAHYLDYFHGQLKASPDGSRIFDDGWVWHPISVPRTWSVTDWLGSNPWESEDGDSIVDLTMRDEWNTPACWICNQRVAVWGLAEWEEEECEEAGKGSGVRIFDATAQKQSPDGRWPMDMTETTVRAMFSDGQRLYIAEETGTTVWDIASRLQNAGLPNFSARLYDAQRGTLIGFGPESIVELPLPGWLPKAGDGPGEGAECPTT
jgi:hypothetical protein